MANYVQAGADYSYRVSFTVDGEFVTPETASISVQKSNGTFAGGVQDEALETGQTSVYFKIPSAANIRTQPYELRYVSVQFTYQGVEHLYQDVYTLRDSVLMPVTKNDVRAIVSMTTTELPDDNIDIFMAYGQVDDDMGGLLASTLNAGSLLTPHAQRALTARAALNSCTMIDMMWYQSEQADNTLYSRFAKVDFEAMLARLAGIYTEALGLANAGSSINTNLFTVFTDTDPVTGA